MRGLRALLLVAVLLGIAVLFPVAAAAEVMDKEPTLLAMWVWALLGGALGVLGWGFRWWAGAALAVLPTLYFVGLHFELTDPYVGPTIVAEAGRRYFLLSYGAVAVFMLLHAVGLWLSFRRRKHVAS